MQIALDTAKTRYIIKHYSQQLITVNETDYTQSIIISPSTLLTDWAPQTLAELRAEDFAPILELKPSIFLLGVGEKHQFPAPVLLQAFYQQRIGVEVMTTAAACRTFNILAAEGRAVVAALLH